MKTFLVTGAAGFIGGAVAKHLLSQGQRVITIDNLSTGIKERIPEGVVFYEGNCQDSNLIAKLEKYSFDCIFHIAGQSSGEISFDNPVYDLQTNTQSTLLLLKLALKTNCKKFIYASTMSVYGYQEDKMIDESSSTFPKSFYGVGKLASEHYLRIYSEFGIQCTSLRLFNVYGPGQNMGNMRQGMVSIFISQAISNKRIHVKGSKDRFRDFVYIDDVVQAFVKAYLLELEGYKCLNVCTNARTTVENLVNYIKKNFSENIPITYQGSTPGDQFGIYGDNTKMVSTTGWRPKYDLKIGLEKMINWAKEL